jgi:uncharacterized protein YuzE
MEYRYDADADCVYITINKLEYAYSEELDETRFVDHAEDGTVIGIELLYVSGGVDVSGLPYEAEVSNLLKENNLKVYA